jgi:predicted alpha/beta hydrolase
MLRGIQVPGAAMSFVELPVVAGDGHTSRLRLFSAGLRAPGVFWLPALGVPANKYDGLARALVAEGIGCAVHEWRGNGSSSLRARRGTDWGYRELLQHDLPASIAALDDTSRWVFGGHSLGGQFAAMAAARQPHRSAGLALVATGVPHARAFSGRQRLGVGLFARVLPVLTRAAGYYPGHRLGFAGREAGQLMRDWAATVNSGRYGRYGHRDELEAAMAALAQPVLGVRMARDWLVPAASMQALLDKLGSGAKTVELFDDARLGARSDHFRWMRQPQALAACIAAWIRASS